MAAPSLTKVLSTWRPRLVEALEGDVLEIGAGTGENFSYYRAAHTVHAIEPDPKRAGQAERKAALVTDRQGVPIHVQVASAERLPYPSHRFDVVVSSLVFCSVTDQYRALGEIERVLRPNGVLWMVEHVRPEMPLFAWLMTAATPWWRQIAFNCHLDRPTVHLLRQAGWQVEVRRRLSVFVKLRATKPLDPGTPG